MIKTKAKTPRNAPAKKGEALTRHGSVSGSAGKMVSYANRWRENYNPLRQLSIAIAVSLLERGQRGDMALLQWTYRFIERRYPTLSALMSRCEAPLVNFDWQIKIKTELPPDATKEMAEAQKQTLKDAYDGIDNLRDAIEFLATADFRGYSHLQKHYSPDGDVIHLETLHQWCICRDGIYGDWFWNPDSRSMTMPQLVVGEENRIGGAQLPLEDFIIRTVERPIDEIALVNFVRSNLCEKDWDGFIEIYGIPGGVVIMPGNVPPGKESEYQASAQAVAEGGSGAIPNGADYKPNDGPRGVDPFTPRLKHLDEQLIMVGTGGKLTMLAESGSGTLAGAAHTETFDEIAESRAKKISETFQRQFDAGIVSQQHPGEPLLVYFEFSAKDETDVAALVKDVVSLSTAGKTADTAWLNEKTGYLMKDAPPALNNGPDPEDNQPQPKENPPIKNRASGGGSDLHQATKSLAAAVSDDLHPVIARLVAISEIQDDEIFERKLRQFYADFPQLQTDALKDPSADRALLPIITQAFAEGLTGKPKTNA